MKKRTSSMFRRIVSLLMSLVLTLTLVTPAAFATEVVGAAVRPSSRATRTRLIPPPARTARTMRTRTPRTARTNSLPTPVMRIRTPPTATARTPTSPMGIRRTRKTRTNRTPRSRLTRSTRWRTKARTRSMRSLSGTARPQQNSPVVLVRLLIPTESATVRNWHIWHSW